MAPDTSTLVDRAQLRILMKGPQGLACRHYISFRDGQVYAGPYDFGRDTLTEARRRYERSRAKVRLDRLDEATLLGMWSLSAKGPRVRWDYTPRPDVRRRRGTLVIDAAEHPLTFIDLWAIPPDDDGRVAEMVSAGAGNMWSRVIAMARIESTTPHLLCRVFELDQEGAAFVDEAVGSGRKQDQARQQPSGLWVPGGR